MNYNVILNSVNSEKAVALGTAKKKVFEFVVSKDANKIEVSKSFKALYGVAPESVRTLRTKVKFRARDNAQKRHVTKRAIVTLPEGVDVDITKIK